MNLEYEISIDPLNKDKYKKDLLSLCELNNELLRLPKEFIRISEIITRNTLKLDFKKISKQLKVSAGFCVIKNLPLDDNIPETPTNGIRPSLKSNLSEAIILGIISAINYRPFSYAQEKNGALIHEITPIKERNHSKSSNGTVELDFHTDAAYLERSIRPNILALFCLKNSCKTPTKIIQLSAILDHLSDLEIYELMQNNYLHCPPNTFTDTSPTKGAVLCRHNDRIEITLSSHNTSGFTSLAETSLAKLRFLAEKYAFCVHTKPGDLVIFNNFRCLHGRGKIKEDKDRWLQRGYGSENLKSGQILDIGGGTDQVLMDIKQCL